MSFLDEWVLDFITKVTQGIAVTITREELIKRIPDFVSKEDNFEFRKRLASSFSSHKISKKDYILKLSDYPGLLHLLRDEEFRKKYLKLDMGNGVVILDEKSEDVLSTARTSIEHRLLRCLKGWVSEYFSPDYTISLPGTLSYIESKIPSNLRPNYKIEYDRFQKEKDKELFELIAMINKITNLELAVRDYDSEVTRTLMKISDILYEYIKEYDKLMDSIYPKITYKSRNEIGNILYCLQQRMLTFVSGLDLIAKIYGIYWHSREDWPMHSLEKIGKQVIKFLFLSPSAGGEGQRPKGTRAQVGDENDTARPDRER